MTLESFCVKHDLYLRFTETLTTITVTGRKNPDSSSRKEIRKQSEWSLWLLPPVLDRRIRVVFRDGSGSGTLLSSYGKTKKEVRENLLKRIRRGILEYSNSFDRKCNFNPQIKVPNDLR